MSGVPEDDAPQEVWDDWLDQIGPPMPPIPQHLIDKLQRAFSAVAEAERRSA